MRIRTAISYLLGRSKADLSALRRVRRKLEKRQRQKLYRAEEKGRSPNSEVVMEASPQPDPSNPNVDSLSATMQARTPPEGNEFIKFLDDFEKKLRQRTRPAPKARASPVIILGPDQKD